jgi:hypothetical protein
VTRLPAENALPRAACVPRPGELLEQQAVAGLLDVAPLGAPADSRRYALGPEHARVLADSRDAVHVAPFAHMIASLGGRRRPGRQQNARRPPRHARRPAPQLRAARYHSPGTEAFLANPFHDAAT